MAKLHWFNLFQVFLANCLCVLVRARTWLDYANWSRVTCTQRCLSRLRRKHPTAISRFALPTPMCKIHEVLQMRFPADVNPPHTSCQNQDTSIKQGTRVMRLRLFNEQHPPPFRSAFAFHLENPNAGSPNLQSFPMNSFAWMI